jgi:hypothetical protein
MPPDMGGMPPDDMGAAPPEDMGGEATVVATILKNADGSFSLEGGMDEMAAPEMGAEGGPPAPKTFSGDEAGIGELMTEILNIVDPENAEGPAAAANFDEGFGAGEEEEAEPIKPAP